MVFTAQAHAITIDLSRIIKAISKALEVVDDRTEAFDWLAYNRSLSEWRKACEEERFLKWFYITYEFRTYDFSNCSLADFVARIRALRERMWRLLPRTSLGEGRYKSLLASMPTPPTLVLQGYTMDAPYIKTFQRGVMYEQRHESAENRH